MAPRTPQCPPVTSQFLPVHPSPIQCPQTPSQYIPVAISPSHPYPSPFQLVPVAAQKLPSPSQFPVPAWAAKLHPLDSTWHQQWEEKLRQYWEAVDTLLGGVPPAQVLSLISIILVANPIVDTCWNLCGLGALGGGLGVNPKSVP